VGTIESGSTRDATAPEAATALKLTAPELKNLGIVDEVISSKPTTRAVSEQAALAAQVQK